MTSTLIIFEGVDRAGKSTVVKGLSDYLTEKGVDHITVGCPSKDPASISGKLRQILLGDKQVDGPLTEMLLYAAAITDVIEQQINPALKAGKVVLCDRFFDTLYAYQGVRISRYMIGLITETLCGHLGNGPLGEAQVYRFIFSASLKTRHERGAKVADAGGETNHYDVQSEAFFAEVSTVYNALLVHGANYTLTDDARIDTSTLTVSEVLGKVKQALIKWNVIPAESTPSA